MKTQLKPENPGDQSITYGFKRRTNLTFEKAVERSRAALAEEGFGVLCEIDIKAKLKEKLGVDFTNYVILGACNPALAYEGLKEEIDLGLLLPCNVAVYQQSDETVVAAINAVSMLSVTGNERLTETAQLVNEKLNRAIEAV